MSMKLTELFNKSRKLVRDKRAVEEQAKLGVLRAGSSGIMSESGEIAGSCARKSHLRSLGIELEPEISEDKLIMFDLGFASEDVIAEKILRAVDTDKYVVLREEEIPIRWTTSNGTQVSGRPDIVICDSASKKPVIGIELKSVHSIWTAREVLFGRKPKLSNLTQAAHYMWKLGLTSYKLVYTNYSQLGQGMVGRDVAGGKDKGSDWVVKQFPRPGDWMSEYMEYSVSKKTENYTIKHIKQFEIIYDLRLHGEGQVLQYKLEQEEDTEWTDTIVTIPHIERYFEFTSKLASSVDLGSRPIPVDTVGGKAGYTDCNYCPLKSVCDSHESSGYSKWLAEVNNYIVQKKD